jgi:hypothetical protein
MLLKRLADQWQNMSRNVTRYPTEVSAHLATKRDDCGRKSLCNLLTLC